MRKLAFIFVVLAAPGVLLADEVYLKDAGSISGRIVEQNDKIVKVDIGDGFMAVPADRVERIVKGKSPLDEYEERAAKLGAQDVEGWKTLARWAMKEGYPGQARQACHKVLAVAPNDPDVRKALGFVSVNGQWVALEEGYKAKGYVKYQGEWMTPGEAQSAQAVDTAHRAARDAEIKAHVEANGQVQEDRRADRAAEDARREKEKWDTLNPPVYWGGYGYGNSSWPSFTSPTP